MDNDPLMLGGLDSEQIEEQVKIKEAQKRAKKPPTELELQKEERLRQKEERISKKATMHEPAAPEAAAPVPDPTPTIDKSVLLDKIQAYQERFPYLKTRNRRLSAASKAEDLVDELHYIEVQLGSGGDSGNMGLMVFTGVLSLVEVGTREVFNPLNLRLDGLSSVAKDNMQEFAPLIDELSIKYGAGMYLPVEVRLCIAVGTLMTTVHAANSGDPRLAAAFSKMNQPVQATSSASGL